MGARAIWVGLGLPLRENLELGAFLPRAHPHREETLRLVFRVFPALQEKQSVPADHPMG